MLIAVIGASSCDARVAARARKVGELLARRGAVVISGGYGGVMEAAAEGARRAGGLTVGVLSGKKRKEANRWIDVPVVTGMGEARNVIIARSADGAIAVSGGFGTLSEIGFCLKFEVPLVALGSWKIRAPEAPRTLYPAARTPEEAVELLFRLIRRR
jgi:hypothetical protein